MLEAIEIIVKRNVKLYLFRLNEQILTGYNDTLTLLPLASLLPEN
jgi:hypothetical protein